MPRTPCPECGAELEGGQAECENLFHEFRYQSLESVPLARVSVLAFDTYCMQHINPYCVSAKSYVAHLTRLCVGLEHAGNPKIYTALQAWYHDKLVKPPVLRERGSIRITDIHAISTIPEKAAMVETWAQHVWAVYASQQDLARTYIQAAMQKKKHK